MNVRTNIDTVYDVLSMLILLDVMPEGCFDTLDIRDFVYRMYERRVGYGRR